MWEHRRVGLEGLSRRKRSCTGWMIPALVLILGYTGSARSQTVQNPRRLAEGPRGEVLVTDRRHGSVIAVDKESLETVWSFALPDEGAPFGLATWNQMVYVGNTKTGNVEVYRMAGFQNRTRAHRMRGHRENRFGGAREKMKLRFAYNLGHVPPGETGSIENPTDIAVDTGAKLVFVLDNAERKIEIFDRKGLFAGEFFPTDQAGELMSPVSIAVDESREELLVGDFGDPSGSFRARTPARILVYTYGGVLKFQIDGDGSTHETTTFARVQGIAASGDGRIFATDPLGSRVLVLDRESGALLAERGTAGDQPGQLLVPLDVLLDARTGDLFVSNNRGARRIEVLRQARRQR